MFQLIQRYALITDTSGKVYRPAAYGAPQDDLTWSGWLVFFPLSAGAAVATTRDDAELARCVGGMGGSDFGRLPSGGT
jgi:hypothetical protein